MKTVICIDLDGVLAFHTEWKGVEHFGASIPGSVEFTRSLAEKAHIIIYSCRGSMALSPRHRPEQLERFMAEWLLSHGYVFDEIWTGPGKPVADLYIDDKAVPCRPEEVANPREAYNETLRQAGVLIFKHFEELHGGPDLRDNQLPE